MKTSLLIVKHSQQEIFQEFFNDNDIDEPLHMLGKAIKKNFLLDLLNLTNEEKSVFLLQMKKSQENKLQEFCENVLVDKNTGMLIKFKSEKEIMNELINENEKTKKDKVDKLVVTVISAGFTELVMDSVKSLGISGATILSGKSAGGNYSSFLGMGIDSEREVILIACESSKAKLLKNAITKSIIKANVPKGVTFILPLTEFIHYDDKLKKRYQQKKDNEEE